MRQLPGLDPGKLPAIAALAAAAGLTILLAAAVAVYLTGDALGLLLVAVFLVASLALAVSGWIVHWRALAAAADMPARGEGKVPLRSTGQDSPTHRLLEAVAGEVKASASTLTGFAELLPPTPDPGDDEPRRQLLMASRGLLGFAAQLHDYIRFERGRLRLTEQQVDAGELVEAALAACRDAVEARGTAIELQLLDGVELSCDAGRLRAAIASLVLWAAQSSTPGGVIDVRLRRLGDGGLAVDIASRGEASGGAQPQGRLFEPQLSLTGLKGFALPIARRVALLHGGEVTAASSPGKGTAARLTLPAARVAWPEAKRPARAA